MIRAALVALFIVFLPLTSSAELATSFDQPDTTYASNVVIDVIGYDTGDTSIIWFATGEGVNFSTDSGRTWLLYDENNGLVSENISAMLYHNGRFWVASNHDQIVYDEPTTISDGLSYSDDLGLNWYQIDFDAQDILYATGGDRTIYDITAHGDRLFFSAFAGGFITSNDNGENWRRIFPTRSDSINYYDSHLNLDTLSLRNRYFSCSVDTSHFLPQTPWNDSLFVWAGTAWGLLQYVFVDPHLKLYSHRISSIVFCEDSSTFESGFAFLGGENGVTRGFKSGGGYFTRYLSSEIPNPQVTAMTWFGDRLLIGTIDNTTGEGQLAISDDIGGSYDTPFVPTPALDTITDFASVDSFLYMSASIAGLYLSLDSGLNWEAFLLDDADSNSAVNVANALLAFNDTLLIGTDTGLAVMYVGSTGKPDSFHVHAFLEGDSSSARVIEIGLQTFIDTATTLVDSQAVWTVNRPLNTGEPIVARVNLDSILIDTAWQHFQVGALTYDVDFIDDVAFVTGEYGIRVTTEVTAESGNPDIDYPVRVFSGSTVVDSFDDDTVTVIAINGDTIFFGSNDGYAFTTNRGDSYNIVRPNTDALRADFVLPYSIANSYISIEDTNIVVGINSNWIPALDVQYIENEKARVWISSRSTGRSEDTHGVGISRGIIDTLGNRHWRLFYDEDFAWNFAFNGDTVFAATNSGLLCNTGEPFVWDTIAFVNADLEEQIFDNVPVYAVHVGAGALWVGTDDRTLRLSLQDLVVEESYYVVDSATPASEVYAFPVPFSLTNNYGLNFHFVAERDAYVTIEIYDFAMNLVKRVVDNQLFPAGIYPGSGEYRPVWDGRNGKGDLVAVGMYYFKVEFSTGEMRWGKLAIVP